MTEARHWLVHVQEPDRLERRVVDHVSGDERRVLRMDLREGERAYVRSVRLEYAHNPGEGAVEVVLHGLFPQLDCDPTAHPDDTGVLRFLLPPGVHGAPSERDSMVYLPRLSELQLLPVTRYIGLEDAICEGRTSAVRAQSITGPLRAPDFDVFAEGDPLLTFLLEQRHCFDIKPQDVVLMAETEKSIDGRRCYAVRSEVAQRVARFFEKNVRRKLRYSTERGGLLVSLRGESAGVVAVLSMDYVIVTKAVPSSRAMQYRVKLK